jgi:hypothetical protein
VNLQQAEKFSQALLRDQKHLKEQLSQRQADELSEA